MKGFLTIITSLLLTLIIGTATASAISEDDRGFNRLLVEIGWEKADYIDYLDSKGWTLDDFYSSIELGTPLTEA